MTSIRNNMHTVIWGSLLFGVIKNVPELLVGQPDDLVIGLQI